MTDLFVYGTLMPGHARWPSLQPFARKAVRATARGRLWDTGRGYPAARFDVEASPIPGFVVTLERDTCAAALDALDEIEGEGSLFRRVRIATSAGPAASYEWLGSIAGLSPLPNGWRGRG